MTITKEQKDNMTVEKTEEEKEGLSLRDDAADRDMRKQIENFWIKIGRWRNGEDGEDNRRKGNRILAEFKHGIRDHTIDNSINFAAEKLGLSYRAVFDDNDKTYLRAKYDKWTEENKDWKQLNFEEWLSGR